mmetsp:Transcript_4478/g.10395  ORF Transcript_4478/g.10395 Transcript_4478/m.10395 type:complete len:276 (-) Transcript_4478:114-941(-)
MTSILPRALCLPASNAMSATTSSRAAAAGWACLPSRAHLCHRPSPTGLSTLDSGWGPSDTVMEFRSGLMALDTRASGYMTRRRDTAASSMSMATSMRVTGWATRPAAMGCMITRTARPTLGSGLETSSTGRASKSGQMVPGMRDNIVTVASTASEAFCGLMDPSTPATSSRTTSMAGAHTSGAMAASTPESGAEAEYTAKASFRGATAASSRGSIATTRRMASGSSNGRMGDVTRASGVVESSTVLAYTVPPLARHAEENGMRDIVYDGWIDADI